MFAKLFSGWQPSSKIKKEEDHSMNRALVPLSWAFHVLGMRTSSWNAWVLCLLSALFPGYGGQLRDGMDPFSS